MEGDRLEKSERAERVGLLVPIESQLTGPASPFQSDYRKGAWK